MTPSDRLFIEQRLDQVKQDIGGLLELCAGRQKFSPGDKDRVRYEYENLKSLLRGLAIHIFEDDQARTFCHSAGLAIAAELTASINAPPFELTTALQRAQMELSDWAFRLSKW